MKKVLLMRHARATHQPMPDYERFLTDDGEEQTLVMSSKIRKMGFEPEAVITSAATRAQQTAHRVAMDLGFPVDLVYEDRSLYYADVDEWIEEISRTDSAKGSLMAVGHNPVMTSLAHHLGADTTISLPTAGVILLCFKCDSWEDVSAYCLDSTLFKSPKH